MEKLVKLLEDYSEMGWTITDGGVIVCDIVSQEYPAIAFVISKKFGFIKRLVDNDKIDLMKLKKGIEDNKFYCAKWGKITNMLLMLLSIQDNPIEFLISILK